MDMEFEFLPKLPKSDLDDRTFEDLVNECILRIPRYCPEWTNFNPGDPGITMIELFSWLTDQMLVRFNQVPRRNYVAFLELLGIRLLPPTPAQTEVTFYLTAALPSTYQISPGTEVATVRTESQDAIVFSTDRPLTIGTPRITHFLTSETADAAPVMLRDRLTNFWTEEDGQWEGQAQFIFNERPQPGNCFYIVFDPRSEIEGNVLALTLKGEVASSVGINPNQPPRHWEAWTGSSWQPILLQEDDDATYGFSFREAGQAVRNAIREADVTLHLPLVFPVSYFGAYQGRWLRCVYTQPQMGQSGYARAPELLGMSARTIGGTIEVHQCTLIRDELLGESNGTPGQTFQLQSGSILPRREGEHLIVTPPGGLPQIWREVNDFADSGSEDLHYTIESLTGQIQFGPLIREPGQLKTQTNVRSRNQLTLGNSAPPSYSETRQQMERQYGAVPARGATIRMAAYRTGGGRKGNVQAGTIQIAKSAVPYIDRVINHRSAHHGADAESLEDAVIRVPQILRTRDRAVTPEDFETLAVQAGQGSVARALCPIRSTQDTTPGVVDLLIVPKANLDGIDAAIGIAPSQFSLTLPLKTQILSYLDERRLLGVQVRLQEPEYVGVSVQVEVGLLPEYQNTQAQQTILRRLQVELYRFLNPLIGGVDRCGWEFGCPVYVSDIVSLFQSIVGVRYLGAVLLFELRRQGSSWIRTLAQDGMIDPGKTGLICSWADPRLRSSHAISFMN